MTKSVATKTKNFVLNTMRAKGYVLCVLGMGMLTIPALLGASPLVAAYARALRPAGWFAVAAGVALVALHHITQARMDRAKSKTSPPAQPVPDAHPPAAGQPTLGDIRAALKKSQGTSAPDTAQK